VELSAEAAAQVLAIDTWWRVTRPAVVDRFCDDQGFALDPPVSKINMQETSIKTRHAHISPRLFQGAQQRTPLK
jgi:hypothetical protein